MDLKLKSVIASLALACAPSVFAGVGSPVDVNLGTLSSASTSLSAQGQSGNFYTYVYSFNVTSDNTSLSGGLLGTFFDKGGEAYLTGPSSFSQTDTSVSSLSFSGLSAGAYQLRLEGHNGFYSSFSGSITASSVAAPVPEADSYAMLAIGLSSVGLLGWRRRRADPLQPQ